MKNKKVGANSIQYQVCEEREFSQNYPPPTGSELTREWQCWIVDSTERQEYQSDNPRDRDSFATELGKTKNIQCDNGAAWSSSQINSHWLVSEKTNTTQWFVVVLLFIYYVTLRLYFVFNCEPQSSGTP